MSATEQSTQEWTVLVEDDWGPDPLAGVPQEVRDAVAALDHDTAGGCG